eukprot:scaffold26935_cov25-Tisochrysis_lutea.AAC.1
MSRTCSHEWWHSGTWHKMRWEEEVLLAFGCFEELVSSKENELELVLVSWPSLPLEYYVCYSRPSPRERERREFNG